MSKPNEILIMGGLSRVGGFELGAGMYYGTTKLLKLNLDNNNITNIIEFNTGNDNYPDINPNLQFTAGCLDNGKIWIPTDTEVRLYDCESFELEKIISHPCFNNIHSVAVRGDNLYITSTGLDMVVVVGKENGEIIEMFNVEGKPTWHRFSEEIDYRKIHSTRPHECHPNYIFWINDEPWVTRCTQEDAVSLLDFEKRIDISGPNKEISVHDGIVDGDKVYFTSVDGCIVVADLKTLKVIETIELNAFDGYGGLRGWCRGLYYKDDVFYLGFSRLRRTKSVNKLKWVHWLTGKGKTFNNSNILGIDIKRRKIVYDFSMPDACIDAIYSILPYE